MPLEPLNTGDSFAVDDWPLHITVVAPFLSDAEPSDVGGIIAGAASRQQSFTVFAGEDALFGRRENIPVTVIVESAPLARLQRTLVDAVRTVAAVPDEPAFTGTRFRAHVTMKRGRRVQQDAALHLTQIALVDMAPRANPGGRSVLATVDLLPIAELRDA
ncbi:2'-5' RNA ligase superfamily protein [Glaciihabitans tibetensis]|uniref:2'-5' RNA ligase superfamily protein n=2 Tax=Glaciihabitans tibetensis TaxID=1266600 RepID=A0A2T0VH73_9MICO|nr:2'-5' RNA ligase superfamily protein [Glaciihabitans tibetensis]